MDITDLIEQVPIVDLMLVHWFYSEPGIMGYPIAAPNISTTPEMEMRVII